MNKQNKKLNLSRLSKAQKQEFLRKVAGNSNYRPYVERILETFIIQGSGDYRSNETGKILSLKQIRDLKHDYMFIIEIVSRRDLIPDKIELTPYTVETYLFYSQRFRKVFKPRD